VSLLTSFPSATSFGTRSFVIDHSRRFNLSVLNTTQQATSFLLDALKDNKLEQARLQKRLLEMNLIPAPQVADAILGNEMFVHYGCPRTANSCKKAGFCNKCVESRLSLLSSTELFCFSF